MTAQTTRPGIGTELPDRWDPRLQKILREIGRHAGMGLGVQNQDGEYRQVYLDEATGTLRWWDGTRWVGGSGATGSTGTTGRSAGSTVVVQSADDAISVRDYGAIGDGTTDDTAAIQAAIDAAVLSGRRLTAPPGEYLVSDTIELNCSGDLSLMTLTADATQVSPVLRVGTLTSSPTMGLILNLPAVRNTTKDAGWSNCANAVGVQLASIYTSVITVGEIREFGIGLSCGGAAGSMCGYNAIHLTLLVDNKINLRLAPLDSASTCNQNTFYDGRYMHSSALGSNVTGVRQILIAQADLINNNNLFVNPSLEGDVPEYHVENWGLANTILMGRWECSPPKVIYRGTTGGEGSYNWIIGGYYGYGIQFTNDVSGGAGVNNQNLQPGIPTADPFRTVAYNTTTLDFSDHNNVIVSTPNTCTIDTFTGGREGQVVHILFANGNATLSGGSFLFAGGSTSLSGAAHLLVTMIYYGGNWWEVSRSQD